MAALRHPLVSFAFLPLACQPQPAPPKERATDAAAAIRRLFEGFYALPGMTIHWELADAQASIGGDLGYSYGAFELAFNDPKGNAVVDHGKCSTVWRKQPDGTWKVVLDTFNSDLPAPGM